jgi:hypothetical protein
MMTTNEITKAAIKELDRRNVEAWRQNQIPVRGRRFIGKKGQSDIIGYHRITSSFVAVEVKGPGDYLKPDQIEFLNGVRKAGAQALIATLDEKGKFILREYLPD